MPEFARIVVVNDAVAACVGANGLGDGGLVIAGTGSAGIARVGATTTIIGGRGFQLGDDGSAARLGETALRATLRALDGLEPMSELARALGRHFGDDPLRMTRWAAEAKPRDYGAFAPQILDLAKSGDARAREIAGEGADAITALAIALNWVGAERIALVGGLGEPLRPYLSPDVARRLVRPRRLVDEFRASRLAGLSRLYGYGLGNSFIASFSKSEPDVMTSSPAWMPALSAR